MTLIVLIVCSPILIPLFLIALFLAIFGNEFFPPKYHQTYILNDEGDIIDIIEDRSRPIRQHVQSESDYDDLDDDDDDWDDDDDDDWDDDDDDDDWDDDDWDEEEDFDDADTIEINKSTVSYVNGKKVDEKKVTIKKNINLDRQGYDCVAVIDGKTYRFNDGEEPPEVLKIIEDTRRETKKIREETKAAVKAQADKLNKDQERLERKLRTRSRADYDFDDEDEVILVEDDDFDSFDSYQEEPEPEVPSEEPMLYGGLPYGDGEIYFEDDGDAYL